MIPIGDGSSSGLARRHWSIISSTASLIAAGYLNVELLDITALRSEYLSIKIMNVKGN
jgi:hypothetical protein